MNYAIRLIIKPDSVGLLRRTATYPYPAFRCRLPYASRCNSSTCTDMTMYKRLTEIPIPTTASFTSSSTLQITSSFHDHLRNVKSIIRAKANLSQESPIIAPEQHDTTAIGVAYSASKQRRVVLRETTKDLRRYVEIWKEEGNILEAAMDVTDFHQSFLIDEHIASLTFSPDETSVLYTAEGNKPEPTDTDPYARFRYKPHFGEGIVGKKQPRIFLFSWRKQGLDYESRLTSLNINASALFAQAIFGPNGDQIFATGYEYTPDHRLLGIKYCTNRPSSIWEVSLPIANNHTDGEAERTLTCSATRLTPTNLSCRSPRLTKNEQGEQTLLWLASPVGGPHNGTSSLYALDLSEPKQSPTEAARLLVEVVKDPSNNAFPGLYTDYNLPAQPFLRIEGSDYLVTHSIWGCRTTTLLISMSNGNVRELTPDPNKELHSWKVLATDDHSRLVCTRSTPSEPPVLLIGQLTKNMEVEWLVLQESSLLPEVKSALSSLKASVIPIPACDPTEAIVIGAPSPDNILPCITFPHGGPHGTLTTAFTPSTAALALEGYTIALVNYTGSLGYGESAVQALLGNCGKLDVRDCIETTRHLVKLGISATGPGQQFISGGSHGGFLGAHLIGQYPDVYTAAALRNPVISAAEMTTTDIPDWYFSEFGIDYPLESCHPDRTKNKNLALSRIVTPEVFNKVFQASPMSHVQNVRAAVLLLIGAVDLRVAPQQGMNYYHALKGLRHGQKDAPDVEMLVFDGESHPLEGVEAARVGWEATRDFFNRAQRKAKGGALVSAN